MILVGDYKLLTAERGNTHQGAAPFVWAVFGLIMARFGLILAYFGLILVYFWAGYGPYGLTLVYFRAGFFVYENGWQKATRPGPQDPTKGGTDIQA